MSEEKPESEAREDARDRIISRITRIFHAGIISVIILSDLIYFSFGLGGSFSYSLVLLTTACIIFIQGFIILRGARIGYAGYIQFAVLGLSAIAIGTSTTSIIYNSFKPNNQKTWAALDAPNKISDRDVYIVKAYIKNSITEDEIIDFVVSKRPESIILDSRDDPSVQTARLEPVIYAFLTSQGFKISPEKQEPRSIRKPRGEIQWTWALSFDREFGLPIEGNSYPLTLDILGSVKDGEPKSKIATITKYILVQPSRDTLLEKVLAFAKDLSELSGIIFIALNALAIFFASMFIYIFRKPKNGNRRIQRDP